MKLFLHIGGPIKSMFIVDQTERKVMTEAPSEQSGAPLPDPSVPTPGEESETKYDGGPIPEVAPDEAPEEVKEDEVG